jgi:MFS transporter, OPA family, glycerol-3-phosphate transporter
MKEKRKPTTSPWILPVEIGIAAAIIYGGSQWVSDKFLPILILLVCVIFMVRRLPKIKEEHSGQLDHLLMQGFRHRRALNWMIAGLAYAFLYWGRYNLNGALKALGGSDMVHEFHLIFGLGTLIYGLSFLINGPLTDRFGGRFSLITGVSGALVMNLLMGLATLLFVNEQINHDQLFRCLLVMFPLNMYFQSFGAVAIVKINSPWFHVRERGVFGAIFGILISLGIYFAYDWTGLILKDFAWSVHWAFFVPTIALSIILALVILIVRNRPSHVGGLSDFKNGDATSGDNSKSDHPITVFKMMISSKIIMTIAAIEFCSGFLRQAIMQNYPYFATAVGYGQSFVSQNWGMMLCCAGILGGVFAGVISDHIFGSRRGPVAAVLYGGLLVTSVVACFMLGHPAIGLVVIAGSLCVIGVHGMLSGTASMDFGGAKNAGIAVGLIDGFVYLGTAVQSGVYAVVLPSEELASVAGNWIYWPVAMIPFAVVGLYLAYRIRNAKPKPKEQPST